MGMPEMNMGLVHMYWLFLELEKEHETYLKELAENPEGLKDRDPEWIRRNEKRRQFALAQEAKTKGKQDEREQEQSGKEDIPEAVRKGEGQGDRVQAHHIAVVSSRFSLSGDHCDSTGGAGKRKRNQPGRAEKRRSVRKK